MTNALWRFGGMVVAAAGLAGWLAPTLPLAASAPTTAPAPAAQQPNRSLSLAPYVPTPQDVVDRMLALAGVTREDVVYDLGCGDGRLVVTAAQRFGARGVGVDFDPERIAESRANAAKAGVEALVTFKLQDALEVDVSPATVVTLYLLSSSNLKLRPRLTAQLRPGARIVSHGFSMGDWEAETVDTFKDANGTTRTLYLWRTDGTVRR
jgi:ubiquinone/menaquinone biosynthesis C-methylase UbiE